MNSPTDVPAFENSISLVEGLSASSVQRLVVPDDVSDVLRAASDLGQRVVPFGGKLSLMTGNIVPIVDVGLDLTGLRGIHSYMPADLTVSVASGTTVSEIQSALAEHGQELPIDVPFPDRSTIGGMIATGFAGPRRLGSGSLKDLLIGCEFVRGDGLLGHAGGMVVKNVSGFEIPRFLHGSWGSLAVLTSVNLKVMPRPKAEATLIVAVDSVSSGLALSAHLLSILPSLAACTVDRMNGETSIAVRILGRDKAVEATIRTLSDAMRHSSQTIDVLDTSSSRQWWQTHAEEWTGSPSDVMVSAGTRPRDVPALITAVDERFGVNALGLDLTISPGTGSGRFQFDPGQVPGDQFWDQLDLPTLPEQTVAYIESAPADWKGDTCVWGRVAGDTLMKAVKKQFDPEGVLNRGRLFV